jgi:hypothetical protein
LTFGLPRITTSRQSALEFAYLSCQQSAGSVVWALQNSTVDVSARLCSESEKVIELAVAIEGDSGIVASDTESVSFYFL